MVGMLRQTTQASRQFPREDRLTHVNGRYATQVLTWECREIFENESSGIKGFMHIEHEYLSTMRCKVIHESLKYRTLINCSTAWKTPNLW